MLPPEPITPNGRVPGSRVSAVVHFHPFLQDEARPPHCKICGQYEGWWQHRHEKHVHYLKCPGPSCPMCASGIPRNRQVLMHDVKTGRMAWANFPEKLMVAVQRAMEKKDARTRSAGNTVFSRLPRSLG
jgi:hypothetical protein